MKKSVNFLIIFIGLALIMIPLSAILDGKIHVLGANKSSDDVGTIRGYQLIKAEKVERNGYGNIARIFPKECEIYQIELQKGETRYGFFASLKESPKQYLGKTVNLKFNRIHNIFGGLISVRGTSGFDTPLPVDMGTPIYGEITKSGI